jgi:predicted AAA+ superfamily ATPase
MIARNLAPIVQAALADTPVVLINGPRQAGKSTLARALIEAGFDADYVTLDDAVALAAARADAPGFLGGFRRSVVIDEIQRAPGLFLALKASVDADRRPGRFLLTGSANVMLLPTIADSLAGRIEVRTLWPLSQGEIEGRRETFIDMLFGDGPPAVNGTGTAIERALAGGYPEAIARSDTARRDAWFGAYVTTIIQRDIRDISKIDGAMAIPRLLALLASRATATLNMAELSRTLGLPHSTLARYMTLLELTFLVQTLPAWSTNIGKRLARTPKTLFTDTGLLGSIGGITIERLARDPNASGPLLENFVAMEIRKQSEWSRRSVALHHFRTARGNEVDLVLEDRAGRVVGIEVKATQTIGADAFKGLRMLRDELGDRFVRGVVLYGGRSSAAFGGRLHALPLDAVWTT